MLVDTGFEDEATYAQLFSGGLEAGQHGPSNSLASLIGFDVHPLRFGSRWVEEADSTTPDRPLAVTRDKKCSAAPFQMLRFEVRPKPLLGRVELGQPAVKGRDQSSGIVGIEWLHGDGQPEIAHHRKDRFRDSYGS